MTTATATAASTATALASYEQATDEFVKVYNEEARRILELERTDNRAAADRHVALASIVAKYMMTYGRYIDRIDMLFLRKEIVARCMQAVVLHSMQLSGFADLAMSLGAVREISMDIERARRRLENARGDGDDDDNGANASDDEQNDPRTHTNGLYEYIPYERLDASSLVGLRGYEKQHRMLTNAYFVIDNDSIDSRMADETIDRKPRTRAGANVILYGPPGTGKTAAARGVAKYLGLNLAFVNAENLLSAYRSETEKNLRALYQKMRSLVRTTGRNVVLLLDEVDGLVKNRSGSVTSGEYSLLTRFLTILEPNDGKDNYGVFSIFTTNRLSNLDDAFRRRCTAIFMGYVDTDQSTVQLFDGILHNSIDYASRGTKSTDHDSDIVRTCRFWVPGDFVLFKKNVVKPLQLDRYFAKRNTTYDDFVAKRLAAVAAAAAEGNGPSNDDDDGRQLRVDLPLLSYSDILTHAAKYKPITPPNKYAEYDPPSMEAVVLSSGGEGQYR